MRLRLIVVAAALLSVPLIARADSDTITTFDLNSTFQYGAPATIDGTIEIDITDGTVVGADLTATGDVYSYDGTLDTIGYQGLIVGDDDYVVNISGYGPGNGPESGAGILQMILPVTTLVGYSGSSICSDDVPCADTTAYPGSGDGDAVSGSIEPAVAPTPEPSSFVLLGTGLLGMAGVMRKRVLA